MAFDFTANDIFEMARQIEANGAKFYRSAAACAENPSIKEFLTGLASMEVEHEKVFAGLRSELSEKEKSPTVFDPQGESALYLRALADTRVFFEKQIDLSSIEEVLKAAIAAEKDSILFYLGMKELVPEPLGKEKIDRIIQEEMGHIRVLSKELLAIKH